MWRLLLIVLCGGLLAGCSSDEPPSAAPDSSKVERALAGAPAPLRGLHEQANELLDGEAPAFRKRLRELRGFPVVVNKWASWCPPCRTEFPFFQSQALKRAKKVAFIGVDANDNDDDARAFLDDYPLTYPSYRDPDQRVAAVFKGALAFPTTAFYDSQGELAYVKQGGYATESKLAEDIERYAR